MGFNARCCLFEAGLVAGSMQVLLSAPPLDARTTTILILASVCAHGGGLLTILGVSVARQNLGRHVAHSLCVGMAVAILVVTLRDFFGVTPVPKGSAGGWLLAMVAGYGLVYLYWSTVRILPKHHRPLWHFPGRFGRTSTR